MPEITVQALVIGPDGMLLVRERGAAEWRLPGGSLLDRDATIEEALAREVERWLGMAVDADPDFLDTFYERRDGGQTVVHNVFLVPAEVGVRTPEGVESRWIGEHDLGAVRVAEWLRRALQAAFGGESGAEIDFGEIEAVVGRFRPLEPVFIVTGPAGAGKSTVARELCRRFARAAHIDVDLIRWRMVVSGYVRPEEACGPEPDEALQQLALAARNACALARNFGEEGFVAVIDDVLETREQLDLYLEELHGTGPVYVATLLPDAEVLAARDAGRDGGAFMGSRSEELRRIIAGNGETRGLRLDTSAWTPEQVVDIILERLEEARVTPVWEESL